MLITLTMGAIQKILLLMTMSVSIKVNIPKLTFVAVQKMVIHVPPLIIVTTRLI